MVFVKCEAAVCVYLHLLVNGRNEVLNCMCNVNVAIVTCRSTCTGGRHDVLDACARFFPTLQQCGFYVHMLLTSTMYLCAGATYTFGLPQGLVPFSSCYQRLISSVFPPFFLSQGNCLF